MLFQITANVPNRYNALVAMCNCLILYWLYAQHCHIRYSAGLIVRYAKGQCRIVMLRFDFIDFDRFRFDFSINNSISIRFGFDFFYDLHTSVDPTRFVCGRVGTAVLRCWPPTKLSPHRCRRRRLEQGRCWVGKYKSNSVALWHGAEAAKLESATAHTNSIHCFSSMRPVFIVGCANQPYSSK